MIRLFDADVVVIGAGISGLTAAALLARFGMRAQVIERHNVVGGCASAYQRGGYRFDVGATLVGGFGPRGVHTSIFRTLGIEVAATPIEPSMVVHIGERRITRWGDGRWRGERLAAFGPRAERFWREQERIADLAWQFSTRFPALPADLAGIRSLVSATRPAQLALLPTLGRTVASIMPDDHPLLEAFVDAQLLITAQASAREADLAYGATALDLAREGTFHLPGGIGSIAIALARCVRASGSQIAYSTSAEEIMVHRGRVTGVRTADGQEVRAPRVVAAIPVQRIATMLAEPGELQARAAGLPQRWSAFMAYVGVPAGVVPAQLPLHHQLVADPAAPLGEGNSTFLSCSSEDERGRARSGGRAITLSTHTDAARWERAQRAGTLESLRCEYGARLLAALDRVIPGASERADLVEFATPFTFERYTGRPRGLVGGVPQTAELAGLNAISHHSGIAGLTLCGDTTFPGQSTVGASLSGAIAARTLR